MGLDMYLEKRTYVKNWNHMKQSELHDIIIKKGGVVDDLIKTDRITYITEEVGYWRKVNCVHQWFVDNVQDGNDNCGSYYVSRERLQELKELCKEALDSQTPDDVLPNSAGFFFGGQEYDEDYKDDLRATIKILDRCLAENTGEYYYQASW